MKPYCVICKVSLNPQQSDSYTFNCPRCKKEYVLYYEMLAYEDDLESSHEDEAATLELQGLSNQYNGGGLLAANDNDDDFEPDNNEKTEDKGKIPVPPYMKGSNVLEFNEDIETL